MSLSTEAERIEQNVSGEVPPPVEVRLACTSSNWSGVSVSRVREVMMVVASKRTTDWPDDSWWVNRLPSWFLGSFEGHSIDDILQNSDLWDFGSWLDAMKHPGWEWWSSSTGEGGWTIRVCAHSDPYSIEPLAYLCKAAGADTVSIEQ